MEEMKLWKSYEIIKNAKSSFTKSWEASSRQVKDHRQNLSLYAPASACTFIFCGKVQFPYVWYLLSHVLLIKKKVIKSVYRCEVYYSV